jgi:glutamine cyclotransferase
LNSAAAATKNNPLCFICCIFAALALFVAGAANAGPLSPTESLQPAPLWQYRVTARVDQDRALFTQGLVFDDETLWISSGLYAQSHIVALDAGNKLIHKIMLPDNVFGEGLTIANDKLWALSWQEQRVLRFDLATRKPLRPLYYEGQGWGLTYDGRQLIRSDGSSTLTWHRSSDFKAVRTLRVTDAGHAVHNLNELEWIDGQIYANVWLSNFIVIIDPASGRLVGRLDLAGLLPAQDAHNDTDVLNGIAWNSQKRELWVTGKRWPARFRIDIIKPGDRLAP